MLDYLLALLRTLLRSFLSFFGRIPAAKVLLEWIESGFRSAGPIAGFFLIAAVIILGTLSALLFFWVLGRRKSRLRRGGGGGLPFEEDAS